MACYPDHFLAKPLVDLLFSVGSERTACKIGHPRVTASKDFHMFVRVGGLG